jgi:hypothetical protein
VATSTSACSPGRVEALGPEGDVDGGAGAQVAVVLVGAEEGGEVVDDPGLGEAAAALELAGLVEGPCSISVATRGGTPRVMRVSMPRILTSGPSSIWK